MPTHHKGPKTDKKEQKGSSERDEPGRKQAKQYAEHKLELGDEKQLDLNGKRGVIGNEDDDWEWSDGELDDERLQAFFEKRPITCKSCR